MLNGLLKVPDCEAICFSNDNYAKKFGHVTVLPWRDGVFPGLKKEIK